MTWLYGIQNPKRIPDTDIHAIYRVHHSIRITFGADDEIFLRGEVLSDLPRSSQVAVLDDFTGDRTDQAIAAMRARQAPLGGVSWTGGRDQGRPLKDWQVHLRIVGAIALIGICTLGPALVRAL